MDVLSHWFGMRPRLSAHVRAVACVAPLLGLPGCQAEDTAAATTSDGTSTGELDASTSNSEPTPTTSGPGSEGSTGSSTSSSGSTEDADQDATDPISGSSSGTDGTSTSEGASTTEDGTTVDGTTVGGTTMDGTTADETTGDSTTGDGTTGDSTTRGDSSSTGEELGDCEPGDIADAPPPQLVDGMHAVPIDILDVTADAVFSWNQKLATTHATMKFRLGPNGGHPIFDLQQKNFSSIKLDGAAITEADIAHHDFGAGMAAAMRVLAVDLPPCSEHVLEFVYPMDDSDKNDNYLAFLNWNPGLIVWNMTATDLKPAGYNERWLPANLIYDRYSLSMTIEVLDSPSEQDVWGNGAIEKLGPNKWKIVYPPHFTALSMMLTLDQASRYAHTSSVIQPQGGGPVNVELYTVAGLLKTPADLLAEITMAFDNFTAISGAFVHPSFHCFVVGNGGGGMEFEGATFTGYQALLHELFHSWIGRGIKPRNGADGWIDEAYTMYVVNNANVQLAPLDLAAAPVTLCSANQWTRHTPGASYSTGAQVFATIAQNVGKPALLAAMRDFYELHAPGLVSTAEVEQHLHCALNEPLVREVFHRFVYGNLGPAPAPPPGYCP